MTLFERVRAALAPDYDVREEIGRGGMGVVYAAFDPALDRLVAVKVLRPERATARAVERFLREARALAAVEHPCVLQVHRAGEAGGLYYYVMEHVDGETLARRLERGSLSPAELKTLETDLLAALEAIHGAGIVHRDVKPSNIFLMQGRIVLGDFGISLTQSGESAERLTGGEDIVGTPGYLAPEQLWGDATPATDVHAAGLVLYEACTGTSWQAASTSESPWKAVPSRLRAPLRKALQADPEQRPSDGAALRAALPTSAFPRRWMVAAAVAAVLIAGYLALRPGPSTSADLAVLPFEVVGEMSPGQGGEVAQMIAANLEGLPQLVVVSARAAGNPDSRRGIPVEQASGGVSRVAYTVGGALQGDDGMELRLAVQNAAGQRLPERVLEADDADLETLARAAALEVLKLVQPRLGPEYRGLKVATDTFQAAREFLLGEDAMHRNAWTLAEEHYTAALAADSAFALARWRLWNVWRWRLSGQEIVDLEALYRNGRDQLGEVDRALLAAEVEPPGGQRIAALEDVALRQYPDNGYARLLYADELYHRGPLVGRSLEDAAAQFGEAAARSPSSGPAYEHGLLALTRLGREQEARRVNRRLQETATPPAPGEVLHFPTFLEQAFLERFEPEQARSRRAAIFDFTDPERWPGIAFAARMGLALDVPAAQLALGRGLVAAPGAPASLRANGHMSEALALMVLGRVAEAVPQLDSAALLMSTPEARLEAAEWRVMLPVLGIPGVSPEEVEAGRARLRQIASSSSPLADRAEWVLALDAYVADRSWEGREWKGSMQSGSDTETLATLANAFGALTRGRPGEALALTEPLLARQFLPRHGDPFTRTVLHLTRARALEALDEPEAARGERVWSENQDIAHVLAGPIQPVEVDWVASPHSDRRRVRLAVMVGDTADACRLLDRLAWLWQDADPDLDSLRDTDTRLRARLCP